MCGGLESCCVGRVYGADAAVRQHHPHRSVISNDLKRRANDA